MQSKNDQEQEGVSKFNIGQVDHQETKVRALEDKVRQLEVMLVVRD